MYADDQEERVANPIASSRDSIIIGSILIAAFAIALTSICIITIIKSRRSDHGQRRERQSSVMIMRGKEEATDEDLTALRDGGARAGSSVIQLDELVSPSTTSSAGTELGLASIGELPVSFDPSRPVRTEGPLDSHLPSPVLSPSLPTTPVSSNWVPPEDWQVPKNLSTAVARRIEEVHGTGRVTVGGAAKHQLDEGDVVHAEEVGDIGIAR